MDKQYYFVAAALPELHIGEPPDINFSALDFVLRVNLAKADFAQSIAIRRYYDIKNIRNFWMETPFDEYGYYNVNDLEEALLTRIGFPEYVYNYLDKYNNLSDRLYHFPALMAAYFQNETQKNTHFVREYLTFEREWRLVLTGFRAKLSGRDLVTELQFEDPNDEVVAQILAQKDTKTYEPPSRYSDLKALFEQYGESPLQLHQVLCEYRFHKVAELYGVDQFSIARILAYMVQLIIVEKWQCLDEKIGLQVIDATIKEAS